MLFVFVSIRCILHRNHDFVQLFALTDAHFLRRHAGCHCLCQVGNLKGRNLGNKGFAALCFLQCLDNQFHTLMQADPETGHAVIGNRQLRAAVFQDTVKERNDGASAACHVAVTDNGEADILCARISIGCNKQFIGNKLGATVQVDRVYRLVRGKRYHLFHIHVQTGVNYVLRTVNIGLNCFCGVVFTCRNLL